MSNEKNEAYTPVKEPYNYAQVNGTITHMMFREDPKQCQITVLTPYVRVVRGKNMPNYDFSSNYTTVIFFDDAVDYVKEKRFKVDDNVTIQGEMRSYKDKATGKHLQNIKGTGIIFAESPINKQMGEARGKNPADPFSMILLRGQIKSAIYKNNWSDLVGRPRAVSLLVNVGRGNIENKIAVDYYMNTKARQQRELKPGMWVSIYGAMKSRSGHIKDKKVVFNNLVAKELILHDFPEDEESSEKK